MFTVFEEVSQGKYKKIGTESSKKRGALPPDVCFTAEGILAQKGIVIQVEDYIELTDVPVITPNYDVIVPKLSFKVMLKKLWIAFMIIFIFAMVDLSTLILENSYLQSTII